MPLGKFPFVIINSDLEYTLGQINCNVSSMHFGLLSSKTDPVLHQIVTFALFLSLSGATLAGVTIHYEGKAENPAAVDGALRMVTSRARALGWRIEEASADSASLTRVIDEKEVPYRGPVRGVVLRPASNCEPLYLQFDSSLFMQDFVKTQYAGADVHIKVVELLRQLKAFLIKLKVEDEGEYWETSDKKKLDGHISTVNALIIEMKGKTPGLKGPVTLPSGRIVDLMR